jgi:carbonic anhydrase/acetyltransferase-like protein (isoleucine patch superfamily)
MKTIEQVIEIFGGKPEDWERHAIGDGWKRKTASVEAAAYLGPDVIISGNAWVSGDARVSGDAQVFGNARVSGDAWVFGNARVFGNAWVFGNARVFGNAQVSGNARVSGNAQVSGDARVFGNAQVFGNARVSGDAWEKTPLYIQGSRHAAYWAKKGVLGIGCQQYPIEEWRARYEEIGKKSGYSEAEIKEYGRHIRYFWLWHKENSK